MISWSVDNLFEYVPLLANAVDNKKVETVLIDQIALPQLTVSKMLELVVTQGIAVVFDFEGIMAPEGHTFDVFNGKTLARDTYLIGMEQYCLNRILDATKTTDGVDSKWERIVFNEEEVLFHRGATRGTPLQESNVNRSRILDEYASRAIEPCLTKYPVGTTMPSSNVHADKYFNAKILCSNFPEWRVLIIALAWAINRAGFPDFNMVLASSYTGSLVAVNVGYLLKKDVHCFVTLGPKFIVKQGLQPEAIGKKAKALLVADMICMGTEVRVAQAYLSALGGEVVGAAALAQYADVPRLKTVALVNKARLENLGYRIRIP